MTIYVAHLNAKIPENALAINTTSRSRNWSRGLSPFFVGPVEIYGGLEAKNVENAWQFSKVYKCHLDEKGEPNNTYWDWASKGFQDTWAHRYPMGRGAIPEYSLWDGEKLGYIDARKKIYIPVYSKSVRETEAFKHLEKLAKSDKDLYLIDFDAYNHKEKKMSYDDVIHCETRKMGHAFVLAMMLDGFL